MLIKMGFNVRGDGRAVHTYSVTATRPFRLRTVPNHTDLKLLSKFPSQGWKFGNLGRMVVFSDMDDAKVHQSCAAPRSRALIDRVPRLHSHQDCKGATRYRCRTISGYDVSGPLS